MSKNGDLTAATCRLVSTACDVAGTMPAVSTATCIVACSVDLWEFNPARPEGVTYMGHTSMLIKVGLSAAVLSFTVAPLLRVKCVQPNLLPVLGVAYVLQVVDNGLSLRAGSSEPNKKFKGFAFGSFGALVVALKLWGPLRAAQAAHLSYATSVVGNLALNG
jgi:hypothetical protein